MNTFAKALAGTVAAGAMVVSSASPAFARNHRGNGISTGDVIAGAVVLGGIALLASAASSNDRPYGYDRAGYRDRDNWGRMNPRSAVEQCVRTAERDASRASYGRAKVTDIRNVRETRRGFEVTGRIAVNTMGRNWRAGDGNYGRGWDNDHRGWNSSLRGYDSGRFTCKIEHGRVVDLKYSGIRGLR
ncbi:MAG TPA: hypothetical protein PKE25_05975 [Novosphingobium sp.]|nr:hypothetical protein [Novosphingobium sp.]